jgi:hypothetical protein
MINVIVAFVLGFVIGALAVKVYTSLNLKK